MKSITLGSGEVAVCYLEKAQNGAVVVVLVASGAGDYYDASRHWYSDPKQGESVYSSMDQQLATSEVSRAKTVSNIVVGDPDSDPAAGKL